MRLTLTLIMAGLCCLFCVQCGHSSNHESGDKNALTTQTDVSGKRTTDGGPSTALCADTSEEHLQRAYNLVNNIQLEQAIREFRCAFEQGQGSFEDRIEFIRTLYKLKRYDDVIDQCRYLLTRSGVEEKGKAWVVHSFLADAFLESGRFDKALMENETARSFDQSNSNSINYLYRTAVSLDGLGRTAEALRSYKDYLKRARKDEPRTERLLNAEERIGVLEQELKHR